MATSKIEVDGAGLRYDEGKPRVDLIPPEAIFGLGHALGEGAKKYAERNWERGMPWSKAIGPLLRHMFKFMMGEEFDKETGVPHIDLVLVNATFLSTYYHRQIGEDDRHIVIQE